jgi:hypothetical protein
MRRCLCEADRPATNSRCDCRDDLGLMATKKIENRRRWRTGRLHYELGAVNCEAEASGPSHIQDFGRIHMRIVQRMAFAGAGAACCGRKSANQRPNATNSSCDRRFTALFAASMRVSEAFA